MMTNSISIGRGRLRARLALLTVTTALASGLAAPAFAQSPHPNLDANGVDLTTGEFSLRLPVASVGSGQAELVLIATDGQNDNWSNILLNQTVVGGVIRYAISLGQQYDNFAGLGTASLRGTGATLVVEDGALVYRTLDGVEIAFTNPSGYYGGASNLCDDRNTNNCYLLPASVSGRSGMTAAFDWDVHANCADLPTGGNPGPDCTFSWRLAGVSNAAGYGVTWGFATDAVALHANPAPAWYRRTSAVLLNGATSVASVGYASPSAGVDTITMPGGRVWRIAGSGNAITAIRRPGASSDTIVVSRSGGQVTQVVRDGIATGYSRSVSGASATMVVTDAQSHATTIVSDMGKFRPTSVTDALSLTTAYAYDAAGRPTEVTFPEGNKVQYGYDSRGNLTSVRAKAKSGSGLSDVVTSAVYPASCVDAACNSPVTTTDARGNVTDYAYDGATGLPVSVKAPAASGGAVRGETRYVYTTNAAGVALLTGVSQCRSGVAPACVGTSDETKTTLGYDANLNLTGVTLAAGDASIASVTAYGYDAAGNLVSVDGPLAGSADVTTLRYDADRRRTGTIAADPDGAGALKRRAVRQSYDAGGRPSVSETGTVAGTGDADWAAFASAGQVTSSYDANGFRTRQVLSGGGNNYALTQYGYDAVGRLECGAVRMNPAAFGSLPASACSLGASGSAGPDRITKTTYDAGGRAVQVRSAYGTAEQSDESASYSNNGRVLTLSDAAGNRTGYEYDGFDRVVKTRYPVAGAGAGAGTSSTSDYEQLGYDAAGNVTSRRLRDGTSIAYGYDALGRLVSKDLPGAEPDVSYGYDLAGRPVSVSSSAQTVTLGYDALGRNTSQGGPLGTVGYQYDAGGRRTRLTWPDGFYVSYDYLATGAVSTITDSSYAWAVSFGYDDLGRRTYLSRPNGASGGYGYDAVSRLSSLVKTTGGSTSEVTLGYGYDAAGGIASRTSSNDAYAWSGAGAVSRAYAANGLNQYGTVGSTTPSYDARGNLTNAGSGSYAYSSENLLTSGSGGTSLSYDPALRLYQVAGTSGTTRFLYDGQDVIGEYNASGTLQKRYVHGPGVDEPLVEYDGSGNRTWLHADERGSVIARSNAAGTTTAIDTYDEYGVPASGNVGRFQYTGQMWVPELGMYYYKARMYAPGLGRFLQSDPIGYGDGLNLYGYVGGDPVNRTDPSGLTVVPSPPAPVPDVDDIVVTGKRIVREPTFCDYQPFSSLCSGGVGGPAISRAGPYGEAVPQMVNVDPSCKNVPAASDPAVQNQALNAMRKSLSPSNPAGATEFGFAVSEPYIGSGRYIGPIVTEGHKAEISGDFINRTSPSSIGNLITGYYPTSVFVHTHPNNTPPSPISDADRDLGRPVIAIDKAGNMTCAVGG